MPTYDYRCDHNNRVVEIHHPMNETLSTWGELCACAGIDAGGTPMDAPVRRLATGGNVVGSTTLSNPEPACASGGCCPSGVCGLN
ncbi:MAG TPA: zinc ribbon domain-containing protein [Acidiferrobacteraceae bacterium]|nr:zinc ribbon domain-containing protein [Acidiferrobacteraceae bacterium]